MGSAFFLYAVCVNYNSFLLMQNENETLPVFEDEELNQLVSCRK